MLSYKMDFSFCACKPGFVKCSHVCQVVIPKICIISIRHGTYNRKDQHERAI